jgi:hypothetical protein
MQSFASQLMHASLVVCRLKLPPSLQHLDDKAWAKLDQTYSLNGKTVSVLQQHDELCDLLSQLALEVKQALAVDRDIDNTVGVKDTARLAALQCNACCCSLSMPYINDHNQMLVQSQINPIIHTIPELVHVLLAGIWQSRNACCWQL